MLYPPILASTQPVIDITTATIKVNYQLASITSMDDFDTMEVIVAQQTNGKVIFKKVYNKESVQNSVIDIPVGEFYDQNDWQPGRLYKVQARLKTSNKNSEWSTVLVLKVISVPSVEISCEGTILDNNNKIYSLNPTFSAVVDIDDINKEIEIKYQYKIKLEDTVVLESGWMKHSPNTEDIWYCNARLIERENYTLEYQAMTNNGYVVSYTKKFLPQLFSGENIYFTLRAEENPEYACIDIKLKSTNPNIASLLGNYVVSRSSEKDNFLKYEDIKFLNFVHQGISSDEYTIIFSDYSIESGVAYRYSFQKIFIADSSRRSQPIITGNSVSIDFEYSYLYRDGIQLRLALNQKISSFKHTVLRTKQDTLGDKYPHITQNGNTYYAEFSLSGLISYQDNVRTFFRTNDNGAFYQGQLVIPYRKYEMESAQTRLSAQNDNLLSPIKDFTISPDLTDNNIFIERKFREKVEEFLNAFNYKLYKSPTEGNIPIALMNVSLTPIASLGRMLYEFSATAYEVLDNSLEELDKYGIINIGRTEELDIGTTIKSFGQLIITKDTFGNANSVSLIKLIKEQQESYPSIIDDTNPNQDYQFGFQSVERIWIEPVYPIWDSLSSENSIATLILSQNNTNTNDINTFYVPLTRISMLPSLNNYVTINLNKLNTSILVNYVCNNKLQISNTTSTLEDFGTYYDFDQIIWDTVLDQWDGDLLIFIQNYIKNQLAVVDVETGNNNSLWGTEEKVIKDDKFEKIVEREEYSFQYFKLLDIEAIGGANITIGNQDSLSQLYIGPGGKSSRFIYDLRNKYIEDNPVTYLKIENASQALVNFVYCIKHSKRTTTTKKQKIEGAE